jgi:E3 ubiquitin-protein ligase MYCBP2
MLFDEPVPLQANIWYVAWARISGPSSDCGSSGLTTVTTEDQLVAFYSVLQLIYVQIKILKF